MAMVQALSSRNKVPKNFIVSPEDRPGPPQPLLERTLPLIDLSGLQCDALPSTKATTLSAIASACEEWGFFQAINHGIPIDIIEDARRSAKEFFELPSPEKHGYVVNAEDQKDGDMEKLQGYGRTLFFRGTADDWMDSLFGFLAPPSLKKLDLWPSQPPQLRSAVESYGYEVEGLIKRLLVAISENLGFMDSDYLVNTFKCNNLFFRANYYPPCPRPDLVLGTHGHTDHGCLTVLLQDKEMDGLQVCKDNEWFSINPVPNAVVINVGDQLKALTNGKYKSALHRGVVTEDKTIMTLVAHLDPPKLAH